MQSRNEYRNALEEQIALQDFAPVLRRAKAGKSEKFRNGGNPYVLILANDANDLLPAQTRIGRVWDPLARKGASVMVAPVAVTAKVGKRYCTDHH